MAEEGAGSGGRNGGGGYGRDASGAVSRKRSRAAVLVNPFSRQLYQMMVRQLHHDGFLAAASAVADASGVLVGSVEDNGARLSRLVANGMGVESEMCRQVRTFEAQEVVERYINASKLYVPSLLASSWAIGRRSFSMTERFVTSALDGGVRDLCFSPDGSLIGCTGNNGLAVVFSVETMEDLCALEEVRAANQQRGLDGSVNGNRDQPNNNNNNNNNNSGGGGGQDASSVAVVGSRNANEVTELAMARRYHDHDQSQSVEVLRFHPSAPRLLTGGRDGCLHVREYAHVEAKTLLTIRDHFPIRSAAWHPTGEYVLFGTDHTTMRLVNVHSGKILTTRVGGGAATVAVSGTSNTTTATAPSTTIGGTSSGDGRSLQHTAGLTSVSMASDGRILASCSLDGSWMMYDGVSGKTIFRAESAHSGVPVTSGVFSRSGQVLLTAGMDAVARLWDLRRLSNNNTATAAGGSVPTSATAQLLSFGEPGKCDHRSIKAVFSHDESHVLCQDASLFGIHSHSVYSGDVSYSLTTQPAFTQRGLAVSPYANIVLSGGDDCRVRMWTPSFLPG